MGSGRMPWIVGLSVSVMAAVAASCSPSTGSAAAASDPTTSLPTPASSTAARGDVIETTLEGLSGLVGPIDISHLDVSIRRGSPGAAITANVRATALETIDSLQLDYCGPPLTFFSVDGSTVVATLEDNRLRARLHSPLRADTEFAFRLLTVMPVDHVAVEDVGDLAAGLLCR